MLHQKLIKFKTDNAIFAINLSRVFEFSSDFFNDFYVINQFYYVFEMIEQREKNETVNLTKIHRLTSKVNEIKTQNS